MGSGEGKGRETRDDVDDTLCKFIRKLLLIMMIIIYICMVYMNLARVRYEVKVSHPENAPLLVFRKLIFFFLFLFLLFPFYSSPSLPLTSHPVKRIHECCCCCFVWRKARNSLLIKNNERLVVIVFLGLFHPVRKKNSSSKDFFFFLNCRKCMRNERNRRERDRGTRTHTNIRPKKERK